MVRGAHGGGDDLGAALLLPVAVLVVLDAGDDGLELLDAVLTAVLKAADERRDVAGAGAGREKRLWGGEDERHVHADALGGKRVARGQGRLADRELHDDVRGDGGEATALGDHLLGRLGRGLRGDGDVLADLADLGHVILEVGQLAARLGIEGRVGGNARKDAPGLGLADLIKVGGVDKELHSLIPPSCSRTCDACPNNSAARQTRCRRHGTGAVLAQDKCTRIANHLLVKSVSGELERYIDFTCYAINHSPILLLRQTSGKSRTTRTFPRTTGDTREGPAWQAG